LREKTVLQGQKVFRVLLASTATKVCVVQQGPLVTKVRQAQTAQQAQMAYQELMDLQEDQVFMDRLARLASLDQRAIPGQEVFQDLPGSRVRQANQEHAVRTALWAHPDLPGFQARMEPMVLSGPGDNQVHQASPVPRVPQALLAKRAQMEHLAKLVRMAHLVLRESQGRMGKLENLALRECPFLALRGRLDHQALQDRRVCPLTLAKSKAMSITRRPS
jgi:hypothetical protein